MITIDERKENGTRVTLLRASRGNYFVSTASTSRFTLSRELNRAEAIKEFHETLSSLRSSSFSEGGVA